MSDNRETKNEVFTAADAAKQGIQTRNVVAEDFGFEIPVETVPLPSGGKTYAEDSALHNATTVQIKAMTAREEDILTSRALIKKGTVIESLVESCLINKKISVPDMLSGDRNGLMTAIRITGYGAEYSVDVECPDCDERSKQDFDLANLPINPLNLNPLISGENIFEFTLPLTKKVIHFKFLTGRDEQEISTIAERKKKKGIVNENSVTTRLKHSILSIAGVTDKNKINIFIGNMPARDSLALRKYIDKNEPGIDMKSWMECPHCMTSSEVRLPMGASFFWPDTE
jgi:hypothetical protein